MVDTALLPAIHEAIKQNELGAVSPYCLSFACLGSSGASFGIFQGDTNVNHTARATLMQIIQGAGAPTATVTRIMAALGQACPNGNPLSTADTTLCNNALSAPAGVQTVDQMDSTLLQVVLGELDSCIAAAATVNQTIDPVALLYIALWVNMTGAPNMLCSWLSGTAELGQAPPIGPTVTRSNLENYLQASSYFRLHPRNFVHMQDSVNIAAALLPQ